MTSLPITVALICFAGDGSPLTDMCLSVWEADTVVECATSGDPFIPLHVNSGTNNPGRGTVRLFSSQQQGSAVLEVSLILGTPFESRGAGAAETAAVYTVPFLDPSKPSAIDLVFADQHEECACFSRSVDPDASCAKAGAL